MGTKKMGTVPTFYRTKSGDCPHFLDTNKKWGLSPFSRQAQSHFGWVLDILEGMR